MHATDLDEHGAGRGLADGLDLHVPGLLPGEHGKVLISHISPHHPQAWATLQERLSQSPDRQIPICAAYGVCGGCTLQHLSYLAQLRWKQARIRTALGELLRPSDSDEPLRSCVGSPGARWGGERSEYRSRVKLIAPASQGRACLSLGVICHGLTPSYPWHSAAFMCRGWRQRLNRSSRNYAGQACSRTKKISGGLPPLRPAARDR